MSEPDQTIVTRLIVTYNSSRVIADCLKSIPGMETVVVDNQSQDDSVEICHQHAGIRVIESGANLGFGGGANRGIQDIQTAWTLIINPDAILDADNLARLLECADRFPDAALIAPAIVNGEGLPERTHDRALHRRTGMSRKRTDPPPEGPVCAEFVSGAVMLVRTSVIREIEGFDEQFFLFYEDDDFCWRIAEAGYSLILDPTAQAVHLGGTSTLPSARIAFRRDYHMGRSLTLYRRKHLGWLSAATLTTREAPKLLLKAIMRSLTGGWSKAARDWGRLSGMTSRLLS
jgi:N-acetylglucosaminyl-diphospho-decaprenol L-rhamnosyltransferase